MVEQIQPLQVLPPKLFLRLKSLRRHNLHGDCYKKAAEALGLTELARQFEKYIAIQAREGHLRHDVYMERHRAYEQLLNEAKVRLSAEQYGQLYMCF